MKLLFSGLRVILLTLKNSIHEFLLYSILLLMAILVYAVLIFYAEQIYEVENNKFESISISLWWAVVVRKIIKSSNKIFDQI